MQNQEYSSCNFFDRSGVGSPVVHECEGEYKHDSRKNLLEWSLPVIDSSNKTGKLKLTVLNFHYNHRMIWL